MKQQNIFDSIGVKDTSLQAYRDIIESGTAEKQRERVFLAIHKCIVAPTRTELAKLTGIPINAICGRVNELVKSCVVIEADKRECRETGKNAYTLKTIF